MNSEMGGLRFGLCHALVGAQAAAGTSSGGISIQQVTQVAEHTFDLQTLSELAALITEQWKV